jgi:hypothetical protein
MALNKKSMANFRLAELAAAYPGIPMDGDVYTEMIKYLEADSSGIIKEFLANAEVVAGIPVSTTGTSSAQTGATTAPGKVN